MKLLILLVGWLSIFLINVAFAKNVLLVHSKQLIVVKTRNPASIHGSLQRYQRSSWYNHWHKVGKPFTVVFGEHGVTNSKREGDGKSPTGVFRIVKAFGIAKHGDQLTQLPYLRIKSDNVCVDDSDSKYYNHIVASNKIQHPDWHSGEQMYHYQHAYHLGLLTTFNRNPTVAGKGSCVFLHVWHDAQHGTAGCTAMSKRHVTELLQWLRPKDNPVLVQKIKRSRDQVAG